MLCGRMDVETAWPHVIGIAADMFKYYNRERKREREREREVERDRHKLKLPICQCSSFRNAQVPTTCHHMILNLQY